MKKMKFFVGALAIVAMVFVSCKNEGKNPPVVDPGDEIVLEDAPQLNNPGEGKVTIAIRALDACNGLYLSGVKGQYPGTTEGTMTLVEGTETWYQITGAMEDFLTYNMKALLVPNEGDALTYDYEWVGEGSVVILSGEATLKDDYGTANALSVNPEADNSVVYVTVEKFKASPCIKNSEYNVSVKVPEMCEAAGTQVYIIGGFVGSTWETAIPMTLEGDVWTAKIEAQPNTEFKVRGSVADWSIELQEYNEETEKWGGIANLKLTEDTSPVFDLSECSWNVCLE